MGVTRGGDPGDPLHCACALYAPPEHCDPCGAAPTLSGRPAWGWRPRAFQPHGPSAPQDLIVHVRDVSHPETELQKASVLSALRGLRLPGPLLDSMLEVHNKVDLLPGCGPLLPRATRGPALPGRRALGPRTLRFTPTAFCFHPFPFVPTCPSHSGPSPRPAAKRVY